MCRSRRELYKVFHSNEYFIVKIGFDTAEKKPCEVCPVSVQVRITNVIIIINAFVEFPSGPVETDYPNLVLEAPIKLISKIRRKNPKKKPAGASTKKPARCVGSRGSVAAPIASSSQDDEDEGRS